MFEQTNPTEAAARIQHKGHQIELLKCEINDIAKANIEDFCWLDHQVSTFWTCEKSPIGMCVFDLDMRGRPSLCRYCHGPTERK